MSERLNNGFVPFVPEFDGQPQPPQFTSGTEALGDGVAPFGFSAEHSTPVIEGDGFDIGPSETRTELKSREDITSGEFLPL